MLIRRLMRQGLLVGDGQFTIVASLDQFGTHFVAGLGGGHGLDVLVTVGHQQLAGGAGLLEFADPVRRETADTFGDCDAPVCSKISRAASN